MKERPILFSGPMVKAILEGRKTQTRRWLRCQPHPDCGVIRCHTFNPTIIGRNGERKPGPDTFGAYSEDGEWGCKSPYGSPGDRLWVRETWCIGSPFDQQRPSDFDSTHCLAVDYAVNERRIWSPEDQGKWRPSIHMPRWASRITLEITGVRVERLKEISDFYAFQEGVKDDPGTVTGPYCRSFVQGFKNIWESINGPGSWDANPWVWVVEFSRVQP